MKSLQFVKCLLGVLVLGLGSEIALADPPNPPGIPNAVGNIGNNGNTPGPHGVGSGVACPVLHQLGSTQSCGTLPGQGGDDSGPGGPGDNGKGNGNAGGQVRGPKRALEVLSKSPSFASLQPVIDRIDAKHCPLPPLP